jgi:F-type H+-transporting ATPase subunit delta
MDLRGASAEAMTALTDQLDDAASTNKAAAKLGDDLFTVSRLFGTEPGLRRFATDASLPAEAKQGMVAAVFGERLDGPVLDLLTDAVGRRWTSSRDLPAALERLSEIAIVKSAGAKTARLTDEIFALDQIVNDDHALRDALSDPGRSVDDKAALLDSLLEGKAQPATIALAKQALAGTYHTVHGALTTYREVAASVQGQTVATVRTARTLSAADRKRLTDALSSQYDTEVHLNEVVDPSVLGGIRVEIGDQVIDGTVSSRLDDARRRLAG